MAGAAMIRNEYGSPVDMPVSEVNRLVQNVPPPNVVRQRNRLSKAQKQAAEARERNFPPECDCAECVRARNLPAVQRILAAHKAIYG